jgi:integrase
VGDRYRVGSYRLAIHRGCDRAFPPPPHLAQLEKESEVKWTLRLTPDEWKALARWRKQHRWSPGQLRHNAATAVRRHYGGEAAQVILGHTTLDTTLIYAERDAKLAERIMSEIG